MLAAFRELKLLYVAVTRAKNGLVCFDRDMLSRHPFYFLLQSLGKLLL